LIIFERQLKAPRPSIGKRYRAICSFAVIKIVVNAGLRLAGRETEGIGMLEKRSDYKSLYRDIAIGL
jgi:hypothetical protein